MAAIDKRYEFVLLFDVLNGNPNGDPDAGNMPRTDPETGLGLVTDVCLKRKVRNYVALLKSGQQGYDIYVQEGAILNLQHQKAYDALQIKAEPKKLPKKEDEARQLTAYMCQRFFDIRAFGAVMSTEVNCGQVRGPVQLAFARSMDPIYGSEASISCVAARSEDSPEMRGVIGRKQFVPYGLYRAEGYVSAALAEQTGFSAEDLELLWEALMNMFEHDHSAARGQMASRKLFVFEHSSRLGNAPAHKLFETIKIARKDSTIPPRQFDDYVLTVETQIVPTGVRLVEKL